MIIELYDILSDKKLRTNYKQALKIKTKEECDAFLLFLPPKEHEKLIFFSESVIRRREKARDPINEYFLLHINEYKTEEEKQAAKSADITLVVITIIAIIVGVINALVHVG